MLSGGGGGTIGIKYPNTINSTVMDPISIIVHHMNQGDIINNIIETIIFLFLSLPPFMYIMV